jgi:hypothetical protein
LPGGGGGRDAGVKGRWKSKIKMRMKIRTKRRMSEKE